MVARGVDIDQATTTKRPPLRDCGLVGLSDGPRGGAVWPAPGSLEYVYHKSFASPKAENGLWGCEEADIPVQHFRLTEGHDAGGDEPRAGRAPLTCDQEKVLFLRYNYAKYRLSRLAAGRGRKKSRGSQPLHKWRRRARVAQEKLVHANLRLVPSMAGRVRLPGVEFSEMLAEGYAAVLRSVEKFDVSRGVKFSTYACRAIFASFCRLARSARAYQRRFPTQFDPELEQSDELDRRHERQKDDAVHSIQTVLERNLADLTDTELGVVRERYLDRGGQGPCAIRQVAERLDLSGERVRQIEKAALAKLRFAVNEYLGD